jgi:hypothetical protein
MTDQTPTPHVEQPRSEPEIIPPGESEHPWLWARRRTWHFTDGHGTQRLYFARLGPFSTFLLAAAIALVAALLLIVFLGAFLIWIPILAFLIAAAMVSGLLRGFLRR